MTKTEIIDSLLEQARNKLSFGDDDDNTFKNDVRALVEAAQLLMARDHEQDNYRRHGEWKNHYGFTLCSKCGEPLLDAKLRKKLPAYCQCCGAKMDGGEMCDAV